MYINRLKEKNIYKITLGLKS